ncbi:DUF4082 domain-containing protein, partial [Spongiactinospora gelatinilytica]|uniref:DUF4082 domain-containing protein n=1 Tax=Spongiactinospora gelatinilytica TaxID=2666298 RepID=UPI001313EC9C
MDGESALPDRRRTRRGVVAVIVAAFLVGAAVPIVWLANRGPQQVLVAPAGAAAPVREAQETSLWNSQEIVPARYRDRSAVELGTRFTASRDGWALGVRFFKAKGDRGGHTGSLWDSHGRRVARVTFTGESATGWQQAHFAEPVRIKAGRVYTVSYHARQGVFVGTPGFTSVESGPLRSAWGKAGVYQYGRSAYPRRANPRSYNYWVDVIFRWYEWRRPTPKP